jgi:tyrosine-specific transport protein
MKKDIGAILLVCGTTIGAGMLALPTITSPLGFLLSCGCYLFIFSLMLLSGYFLVKLVLHYPEHHNFVSLSKKIMGQKGAAFCWIIYLLLMYALVAAYLSASASLISSRLSFFEETWLIFLLPVAFSIFLKFGIKGIDRINQLLMFFLIASFVGLMIYLGIHQNLALPWTGTSKNIFPTFPIIITAFGYHIIIPSISSYLDRNFKRIIRALVIGSFIPLTIYILWQWLVSTNLSLDLLQTAYEEDIPLTELLNVVHPNLGQIAQAFAFFAIVTSFLGVALSLYDFLKDSLPSKKVFKNKIILFSLTFLPPIIYIFYFKKAFYLALDHAGILVSLLLIILPSWMFYLTGKKYKKLSLALTLIGFAIIVLDVMTKIQ